MEINKLNIPEQVNVNTERIDRLEDVIYGTKDVEGLHKCFGTVYDNYKSNKKLIKILAWVIGLTFGLFIALTMFTITYSINQNNMLVRATTLMEQHLKESN